MFKLVISNSILHGTTYIKLKVDYSELRINFNPTYTTVRADFDFVLDGTVAVDPDKTSQVMNYL